MTHETAPLASFERLPEHVGFNMDANRRWATREGKTYAEAYATAVDRLVETCSEARRIGIREVTIYVTHKNHRSRERDVVDAILDAGVDLAARLERSNAVIRAIGDREPGWFPDELAEHGEDREAGGFTANLLVNYSLEWEFEVAARRWANGEVAIVADGAPSAAMRWIDLLIRTAGLHKLSGFAPYRAQHAFLRAVPVFSPDFSIRDFHEALAWWAHQEVNPQRVMAKDLGALGWGIVGFTLSGKEVVLLRGASSREEAWQRYRADG